jgi:hypothetical protein
VVLYPTGILGARISRNEPNAADVNSACTFYFQLPSVVAADYMPLELLAEVAQQPFYNSLRTQQQLGYIVFCGVKVSFFLLSSWFFLCIPFLIGTRGWCTLSYIHGPEQVKKVKE